MLKVPALRARGFSWQSVLTALAGAAALFLAFFWRLGSLTPGLAPAETAARTQSASLSAIYNNPINAPHKLVQHVLTKLTPGHVFELRLASVIMAIIFAYCFYKLAVGYFGRAIGLFAAAIFISLPLFLVSARQASPEIMFFAPVVLIALYAKLAKTGSTGRLDWIWLVLAGALLIYTPGMAWWLIGAAIICRKKIISSARTTPVWMNAAGGLAALAIIAPLIASSIKHPAAAKAIILLPQQLPAVLQILKDIAWMVLSSFIRAGHPHPLILGKAPLLDVLLVALLVFGVYAMQGVARSKAAALGISIVFAIIAAGLNDNITMLALGVPAAGIFIAAGLRYLYIEWRSIFPRNPVPKTFALALIALVTASQVYYGIRYSLVAWPHSDSVRTSYVLK